MTSVFVKALALPIPLLAGIFYVAVPSDQGDAMQQGLSAPQGPEWLIGAVAGIWLVVWLLDKLGKLPSGGPDRRRGPKFEEDDRKAIQDTLTHVVASSRESQPAFRKMEQLHGLLTFRSDDDGIERWLRHHQATSEILSLMKELVRISKEMSDVRRDDRRKTGMLVSTLEANQKALVNMQHQLTELSRAVNDAKGGRSA